MAFKYAAVAWLHSNSLDTVVDELNRFGDEGYALQRTIEHTGYTVFVLERVEPDIPAVLDFPPEWAAMVAMGGEGEG